MSGGLNLRRDFSTAKLLGIPLTRGWRKKLRAIELTGAQTLWVDQDVAAKNTATRNKRMHLRAILADGTKVTPFALHPEMEITGAVYSRLRQCGFDAHLEVTVPSDKHKSGMMRVDIGIIKDGQLVAAIECKRDGKLIDRNARQTVAYKLLRERYGVGIYFINCIGNIDDLINALNTA